MATGPDLTGVPRTWGQVEVEPGWLIYVGVADAVIYAPALREAMGRAAATLLVILIAIAIAGSSYSRIARALSELASSTRTTAAGDIVPLPDGTPRCEQLWLQHACPAR